MNKLNIISWNVNGIRASEKKGLIPWLTQRRPDIFCVQETKANPNQLSASLLAPPGYTAYWNSAEKKGYSGVAIYSRMKPKKIKTLFKPIHLNGEGRILHADFGTWHLFNVYFPKGEVGSPRLKYKLQFYKFFLQLIKQLHVKNKKIIICGDVNTAHSEIDLARPQENIHTSGFLPIERAWIDQLIAAGFYDSFRLFNSKPNNYTWWDMKTRARERNVGWRLDYFFISAALKKSLTRAFIIKTKYGSDHCPVGIDIML